MSTKLSYEKLTVDMIESGKKIVKAYGLDPYIHHLSMFLGDVYSSMQNMTPCPWTKIEGPETLPAVDFIVQVIRPSVAAGSIRQYAYYAQDPDSDSVVWFCPITNRPLDTEPTHHASLPDPPK